MLVFVFILHLFLFSFSFAQLEDLETSDENGDLFKIEGKVLPPDVLPKDWYWNTRLSLIGGKRRYSGYLREDSSFIIHGLLSGSYYFEVLHSDFYYPPLRIDINTKGKVRARKVNHLQPSQVTQVTYPLRIKSLGRINYFEMREQWKWTDILMNPMILMMLVPLLIITILPNLMNDPETKREMAQMQQNMNVHSQLPEISELAANFFGGSNEKNKKKTKAVSTTAAAAITNKK